MTGLGRRVTTYLAAVTLTVIIGFPLYWMLDTALSDPATLYTKPQALIPSFSHLGSVFSSLDEIPVIQMLGNSTFIAAGTSILSVLLALLAAYPLSRFSFRGKGLASFLLFATQMVPEGVFLIPLYALFLSLGLINSLTGLVLINTAFTLPVSTFLIKTGMDRIPQEIDEAARIDNCPPISVLSTVIVPLVIPSIASAAVLAFFSAWNELMFASTFLTDQSKWPASVQLAQLADNPIASTPVIMFVSILYTLPAIVFFLIVQRRIVAGLTAGAVKG